MTTFPVKKGEVIEHGEGHSSTAKRDGIAYFDGAALKMLPDERPIQFVDFTLRSDHDRVTIDGKTYTTPELRAALAATEGAKQ